MTSAVKDVRLDSMIGTQVTTNNRINYSHQRMPPGELARRTVRRFKPKRLSNGDR